MRKNLPLVVVIGVLALIMVAIFVYIYRSKPQEDLSSQIIEEPKVQAVLPVVKDDPEESNEVINDSVVVIDKEVIKVGDVLCGLKVKSLEIHDEYLNDITFEGEIEISGEYEYSEYTGDGDGYCFTMDEESTKKFPHLKDIRPDKKISLSLHNRDVAEKAFGFGSGHATVVIDEYSVGMRQIMTSAKIVRVVSMTVENKDTRTGEYE